MFWHVYVSATFMGYKMFEGSKRFLDKFGTINLVCYYYFQTYSDYACTDCCMLLVIVSLCYNYIPCKCSISLCKLFQLGQYVWNNTNEVAGDPAARTDFQNNRDPAVKRNFFFLRKKTYNKIIWKQKTWNVFRLVKWFMW